MTNTFDFYIYPREADASKRISLQNIGAFILDTENIGDDFEKAKFVQNRYYNIRSKEQFLKLLFGGL